MHSSRAGVDKWMIRACIKDVLTHENMWNIPLLRIPGWYEIDI
jgi:hypothetical protein